MADHFNCKEQSMLNFKESVYSCQSSDVCSNPCALMMSSLLQWDISPCKFFSQLLKLEHFPSTNFHPYNLKHRSFAGSIDRFKSCVSSFNLVCVVIWVSSELGSTYLYHNSYCRHTFLCHLDYPPGSMSGVSGAHSFLLCGTGLKADGKFVFNKHFF